LKFGLGIVGRKKFQFTIWADEFIISIANFLNTRYGKVLSTSAVVSFIIVMSKSDWYRVLDITFILGLSLMVPELIFEIRSFIIIKEGNGYPPTPKTLMCKTLR
jgi:hypothetical protein